MTSGFQGGTFSKVRRLVMLDIRPFENELFQVISQNFPFLQRLSITNLYSQQNKQHLSTSITFAHLFDLDLARANIDYVVQFLFDKNTSLPRLTHLTVRYETLATVTQGFTNDAARLTCSKIRCLVVKEPFLSTCLFREDTGPNIDSVTKSTNKQTDGPTYGVFLETADIYI
ncbi:unnamed protein product, partial [Rotaria socialis]